VALVAGEVGGVAAEQRGLGVHGAAGEDPAGVGPPGAVVRGVRVAFVVGVLMMDAVGGDPEDGSALERHGAAGGDEVLDPLGGAVAAVGEQAVVGHADADVDGGIANGLEAPEVDASSRVSVIASCKIVDCAMLVPSSLVHGTLYVQPPT
jgi:hypothetical protein